MTFKKQSDGTLVVPLNSVLPQTSMSAPRRTTAAPTPAPTLTAPSAAAVLQDISSGLTSAPVKVRLRHYLLFKVKLQHELPVAARLTHELPGVRELDFFELNVVVSWLPPEISV